MKALGRLFDIIPAIVPFDLQTARTGDWISLKNAKGVTIAVFKGIGTGGDDPDITVQQSTNVGGTDAKDLDAIATIYVKQAVDIAGVGVWTKVTQVSDALFSADGDSAEQQALYVFEIESNQLDLANGFDCVNVSIADVGSNAQLGCAFYLPYGLNYPAAPESLPDMTVD